MEPWQSWALALGLGGAAALYYTQGGKKAQAAAHRASNVVEQAETTATSKRKQTKPKPATPGKSILVDSATSEARQRKADKRGPSHQREPSVTFGAEAEVEVADQAQEDKDWARQLAANKKGVTLSSSGNIHSGSKRQNKKHKQPKEQPNDFPAESASSNIVSSANDVSDMLEPTAPGPSVIRITGEEKAKKAHAAPAVAPQETKKQRQNRKKAEEKKLQREQDEIARQALLENQRRTARESRGEPARNGLGASPAPASKAWSAQTAHPVVNGAASPGVAPQVPLLDTFEPESTPTPSAVVTQTPATVVSSLGQDIPSEETQMEMLNELNGWAEVPSKAKKSKKDKKSQDAAPATSEVVSDVSATASAGKTENKYANISTSELIGGKKTGKKVASTNGYAALEAATEYTPLAKGHPQDSDWAAN